MNMFLQTLAFALVSSLPLIAREPLRLHPDNPHYFPVPEPANRDCNLRGTLRSGAEP